MTEACKDVLFTECSPSVINNDMLLKQIDAQRPSGEAGRLAREDGIVLEEVVELRLDFLHILRIDHLWVLSGITKLSMCNNMIEKIENLETLIHLKELDLSFNEIERIENLEELIKLETLTLYSNRIQVIENMITLKQLHIFSIGKNLIEERETIFPLRRLRKLRSINMAENQCADEPDFRFFVATFLPQVTYYEYKRISPAERETGLELFKQRLKEVKENEAHEIEMEEREEAEKAEAEFHAESFIEFLGQRQLFDSLFEKDPDGKILLEIDEVETFYKEYETAFLEVTRKLFEAGQEKYTVRKDEVTQFFKCVGDAKLDNQKQSQDAMERFLERKAELLSDIKEYEHMVKKEQRDENDFDASIYTEEFQSFGDQFQEITHTAWKDLMGLEMTLFDQLEETNLNFERTLTEMINTLIEEAQGFFTQLRTFEQVYMEHCFDEGNKILATYQENPDALIISNDLEMLCEDKELMINAVAASHDIHMQLIDGREDRLVSRAKQWLQNLVNNLQKDEIVRNRDKVLEINHFLDCQREEFEEFTGNPYLNTDLSDDVIIP